MHLSPPPETTAPPPRATGSRRRWLWRVGQVSALVLLAGGAGRLLAQAAGGRLAPTPAETEGPYYPPAELLPRAEDGPLNQLRQRAGRAPAKGQALDLHGRVVDTQGRPQAGITVELWQTDGLGNYLHPAAPLLNAGVPRDPGFAGYGRAQSDGDGRFVFHTVSPLAYASRPPHLHLRLSRGAQHLLTTQLYFPAQTEERGATGRMFRGLWAGDRQALTLALSTAGAVVQAQIQLVLA